MPVDGADVEEVLAVLAQGVPRRHVGRLQVVPQGRPVGQEEAAEVAAALLREEDDQFAAASGCNWKFVGE